MLNPQVKDNLNQGVWTGLNSWLIKSVDPGYSLSLTISTEGLVYIVCRDQHVRINYLNVLPDKWIDYAWNPLQFSLDTEYDCDSIMHYR